MPTISELIRVGEALLAQMYARIDTEESFYKKLTLPEDISQEVVERSVRDLAQGWGFLTIQGVCYELHELERRPFSGEKPIQTQDSEPFGYYNYYEGDVRLDGRLLSYGKCWGPLAAHYVTVGLEADGTVSRVISRTVS